MIFLFYIKSLPNNNFEINTKKTNKIKDGTYEEFPITAYVIPLNYFVLQLFLTRRIQ